MGIHGSDFGQFTLAGRSRIIVMDIEILAAQNLRLEVRLKPGSTLTAVIVTDTAPFYTAWSPKWAQRDQRHHFNNGSETGTVRRNPTLISELDKISFEPKQRVRSRRVAMKWSF